MTASGALSTLPPLSPIEEEHSRTVARVIHERVESAGGWLSFESFMELALYAPGLGYYSAGGQKIGAGGDFTTAPELSDLFSICVARQCAEVLGVTGGSVLELGAGTGRMAAAMLEALSSMGALPEQYAILEVSADLRERQQARLAQLPAELRRRVVWLDTLPAQRVRGVIVANEVLDALPCRRVVASGADICELGVGVASDGTFVERERAADEALVAEWERVTSTLPAVLPDDYRTELCLRADPWIATVADRIERGLVLLFDYGLPRAHYYHPQRSRGTLRCHYKQLAHDNALINVGVQDITAWVDFTRVAEAADAAGLQVSGFATQAAFLLGLGIDSLVAGQGFGDNLHQGAAVDAGSEARAQARRASEARQLLMPGEMGEVFKAMALTREVGGRLDTPLSGFSLQDLRHSL